MQWSHWNWEGIRQDIEEVRDEDSGKLFQLKLVVDLAPLSVCACVQGECKKTYNYGGHFCFVDQTSVCLDKKLTDAWYNPDKEEEKKFYSILACYTQQVTKLPLTYLTLSGTGQLVWFGLV